MAPPGDHRPLGGGASVRAMPIPHGSGHTGTERRGRGPVQPLGRHRCGLGERRFTAAPTSGNRLRPTSREGASRKSEPRLTAPPSGVDGGSYSACERLASASARVSARNSSQVRRPPA